MSKMRVAVVGLGAAGAYCARAAYDAGHEVEIYAVKTGKMSPGATWLHWAPEDITQRFTPVQIYAMGKGTSEAYTKLQWGRVFPSSFPTKPVWEVGYDPTKILDALVPAACNVNYVPFNMSDADIKDLAVAYDIVFQTFPTRESILQQPLTLPFVAAAKLNSVDPAKNVVVYNGTGEGIIVREAQLFGHHFLEFPKTKSPMEIKKEYDLAGWDTVVLKDIDPKTKPWFSTDPKIKLMGRWAMWDRKFLSHDAYAATLKLLAEKEAENE